MRKSFGCCSFQKVMMPLRLMSPYLNDYTDKSWCTTMTGQETSFQIVQTFGESF
jgi:hypothetical protein